MISKVSTRSSTADFAFAAAYAGSVGAGAIALFFLFSDIAAGSALSTPSLMGATLVTGGVPEPSPGLRLDLVAMFSLVHFLAFTVVGMLFAALIARVRPLLDHPLNFALGLFAFLSVGILTVDVFAFPGLLSAIGAAEIVIGNAIAAGAMTSFYVWAFSG